MTEQVRQAGEKLALWREKPQVMVRELFGATPDPWQDEDLAAFPHTQRYAAKAPLCLESLVWTPQGERRFGDLQPGDALFAEDGTPCSVVRRIEVGEQPLFRVTFRDGTSLRVTADHEWDVQTTWDRRLFRRRTVSTAHLMQMPLRLAKTGRRRVSIPRQGPAQFPEANLPADPYVFGLWLGDGVAGEPRVIAPDPAIREAIRSRGQAVSESEAVPKRIGLTGFMPGLRATGLVGARSYEKRIPKDYLLASVEQRQLLLQGLMDSDGTCATNGHTYLATCSPLLAEDFILLARSLGYSSSLMGPYQINDGENRDSYRATLCGPVCPFLADTSKRRRWRAPKNAKTLRFIDRIEPDGHGPAMCVEVDHPSHCFLAGDFIVTHNCKGPGKSTLLSWFGWNFLLTRPFPNCAAISITAENLRDGLWKEMAKWYGRSQLLQDMFEVKAERIYAKEHKETWFMSARSWSQSADKDQQANSLAGFHADRLLYLIDEAGGIPDAVMVAAEAGLSTGIECKIALAGNPTHLSGPLYRASTRDAALWRLREITADPDDPMRTPRVSLQWAREQIQQHGRDHPYVKVNVLGQFPPASINALLGPDEVSAVMGLHVPEAAYSKASRVLGVDVARFGDDSSVIFPRQGVAAFTPIQLRNADSLQGAGAVARKWSEFKADACFIDDTGGYGAGWIDQLKSLGREPIGIGFASRANDPRFYNKRAEILWELAEAVKAGLALPDIPELRGELAALTYTYRGDRILVAEKDQIKRELGRSPDFCDALALTFAQPVQPAWSVERERIKFLGQDMMRAVTAEADPEARYNR